MKKQQQQSDGGNKLLIKFIWIAIICWFACNIFNFINFRFFLMVFHSKNIYLPISMVIVVTIITSLFLTFYMNPVEALLSIGNKTHLHTFRESLMVFKKKLSIFEKTTYLFFLLLIFVAFFGFAEMLTIYIYSVLGKFALIIFIGLICSVFYFLSLIIRSQKFLYYKMGIKK